MLSHSGPTECCPATIISRNSLSLNTYTQNPILCAWYSKPILSQRQSRQIQAPQSAPLLQPKRAFTNWPARTAWKSHLWTECNSDGCNRIVCIALRSTTSNRTLHSKFQSVWYHRHCMLRFIIGRSILTDMNWTGMWKWQCRLGLIRWQLECK